MKATETTLKNFLEGRKQFRIPIYQRTYSWTEIQCEQLWNDLIKISKDNSDHFIGSIVYVSPGYQSSIVNKLLVIDGQQRLTTLSLLFIALEKKLNSIENTPNSNSKNIHNLLINDEDNIENKHKLILTQHDKESYFALIDDRVLPEKHSENIKNNFEYFQKQFENSDIDLDLLYKTICNLMIVDISLDNKSDNPQLIFESLNSTGLDLSQADLIRNYILMGLERNQQESLYNNYWHPMEESFNHHPKGAEYFDRFLRDYLTIKTGLISDIEEVYSTFKDYSSASKSIVDLVRDIHYHSKFFIKLIFEKDEDVKLNQVIHDINDLKVDVAYPFLLQMYVACDKKIITSDQLYEIFLTVESYVFRRAVCDIPTNRLNKIFANLASKLDKNNYLENLKAKFCADTHLQFPTDDDFKQRLVSKDLYNTIKIKYLLIKFENYDTKERISIKDYTIEHIMPQNPSPVWQNDLGNDWKRIYDTYLHTLGNLTLTGYNSELSDKSFKEKCNMENGFLHSPLRLNEDLAKIKYWNESEIKNRANRLADIAIKIWKYPGLPSDSIKKYVPIEYYPPDDSPDSDDSEQPLWQEKLDHASDEVKQNVKMLIEKIHEKFDCIDKHKNIWLYFYTAKPTDGKNVFAVIVCGKNSANISFRVDPDSFKKTANTRDVIGWFFPKTDERRISITSENIPEILTCLDHAYNTTRR